MFYFLFIQWLVLGASSQANVSYLPREIQEIRTFVPIQQGENVFLPEAEIAWADYGRIKRDFPHLRFWSNSEIDEWLIFNFAYISKSQLELSNLRNTEIKPDSKRKRSFRSVFHTVVSGKRQVHNQGRADTMEAFDQMGRPVGLVDRKGAGVDPRGAEKNRRLLKEKGMDGLRMTTGTNGLVLLGQAFVEVAMNEAVQKWLEFQNSSATEKIETIDYYFVMKLPFDVLLDKGRRAPAALVGRQAHVGRLWAGDVLFPGVLNTKQFDFFLSTTDPETIKIKDPVFDEVRSKVSHERRADLYFDRASEIVSLYLKTKDRSVVSDFIQEVTGPIEKMSADKNLIPSTVQRVPGVGAAVARVASLVEKDPVRYHRFAELFYWALNRGSTHLLKSPRFQKMAEDFLALPRGVIDPIDLENPRRYGIYLIPLLPKTRQAYWLEQEIQHAESHKYLARMIWLLPFEEGRKYFAELYRSVPFELTQALEDKLAQPDLIPANFRQVIPYKAELRKLSGSTTGSCEDFLKGAG